jgi:peptidoglycan/xylan/chitin deacetylase (PgdA/CDA1 family)
MTPATPIVRTLAREVRRTARRAHNRLRRTSVILLYHRVVEGIVDPWSLGVAPANFAAQLAVLAERNVVSLDALVADLGGRPSGRQVAVTFDDGYADFASAALPALRARAIPTTLFVTTSALDGDGEFWWDELERIVLAAPALPARLAVAIGDARFDWSFATDGDRRALYLALHRALGHRDAAARTVALGALRRWAGVDAGRRETHRPLSETELAAVAADPLVCVGAHGVSHSYLSSLAVDEQRREIDESKARLEGVVGRAIEHFSYPHGDHAPATVEHVRRAGFRVACGTASEPVTSGADVFDLPRVEVPNLDGAAFARWLDEWVG